MLMFIIGLVAVLAVSGLLAIHLVHLRNQTVLKKAELQNKKSGDQQAYFLPLRIEAYQRLVLYLERIHPNHLVMRNHQAKMSALQLQTLLLQHIRDEFDHNVAQQLFVSPTAWELLKQAKEETIKTINLAASKLNEGAGATELASKIFELVPSTTTPQELAILQLKKELQKLF